MTGRTGTQASCPENGDCLLYASSTYSKSNLLKAKQSKNVIFSTGVRNPAGVISYLTKCLVGY